MLAHFPDADMGGWKHLADFINWGKANYPAKKYLLIVGGHGSGWRGVKPPPGAAKGISYDEPSGNHIAPAELALAIKAGGGVNVYASDACLMQTFEVVYDLKESAEYVVGSQETTPGSGYNYRRFFYLRRPRDPVPLIAPYFLFKRKGFALVTLFVGPELFLGKGQSDIHPLRRQGLKSLVVG